MKRLIVLGLVIVIMIGMGQYWLREKSESGEPVPSQSSSVQGDSLLVTTFTEPTYGYTVKMPSGYKVESEGEHSIRIMPDQEAIGVGPTNFVYVSVVSPNMRESVGEVYNYNATHFAKMIGLEQLGESVNLALSDVPQLSEWFTYTLVGVEDLAGGKAKNFQNNKPWEFPSGTTENRYVYDSGNRIYLLGYYTGGDGVDERSLIDPRIAHAIVKSFAPRD